VTLALALALARKRRDLARPVENSQRAWADREWLTLSLRDDQGHLGLGEAAPLPGYSDDTLDQAEHAVSEWAKTGLASWGALLDHAAAEPRRLRASLATLSSLRASSARFALETALLDLLAQRREEPLYRLMRRVWDLSGSEPASGLPLAQLISHENAEAEAASALERGFTTLKLKVGTRVGFAAELATLSRLRARFGNSFALRLDANQGFAQDVAQTYLEKLAAFAIEFVEEPLEPGARRLENPPLPLALDESLRQGSKLEANDPRLHGVRALILKPSVLGGLSATLELWERARQLELAWVLSHTFESAVGFRALAALALALGPAPLAHGLAPHAALACEPESLGIYAGKLWTQAREAP